MDMLNGSKYVRPRTLRRAGAEAGISLLKRRCWYADEPDGDNDPDGDGGAGDNDGGNAPDGNDDELTRLRAESEEWRKKEAALKREAMQSRDAKKKADDAAQKAEEDRLLAIGEHETVIANLRTENEQLRLRAEIGDEAIQSMTDDNQVRFDDTPETLRYQIPVDYSPQKLSQWWAKYGNKVKMPNAPDFDAGDGGGQSGRNNNDKQSDVKLTPEQKEFADKVGMTYEQYAENLP